MIIASSSGQYGINQRQASISTSNSSSSSSSSSLSPMRPSSSCSPSSDASPKTTVIYPPSMSSYTTRSNRKSPTHNVRYHPYTSSSSSSTSSMTTTVPSIDASSVYSTANQFYSATAPSNSYYDQYQQQQTPFYPQPTTQQPDIDYSAVAANTIQYGNYTDQSYYYAAQNAAAASFLIQQNHQFDSSVVCTPNNFHNQSWKTSSDHQNGYYQNESGICASNGIYSDHNQNLTIKQISNSSSPSSSSPSSSSSASDSLSSSSASPISSPIPSAKLKPGKKMLRSSGGPLPKKHKLVHNNNMKSNQNSGKNGVKSNLNPNKPNKSMNGQPKRSIEIVCQPPQAVEINPETGEPKKRVSANKKERRRTQSINNAFTDLRNRIPQIPTDTKLSKIKTLKLAINYIEHLMKLLQENDPTSFEPFKPDLGKLRRESRSKEIKLEVERKAKGRTGWPSEVWSTELKRKLNDNNSQQPNQPANKIYINNTSPSSSINSSSSSSSSSSLFSVPNGINQTRYLTKEHFNFAPEDTKANFLLNSASCYSTFVGGNNFASTNPIADNNIT